MLLTVLNLYFFSFWLLILLFFVNINYLPVIRCKFGLLCILSSLFVYIYIVYVLILYYHFPSRLLSYILISFLISRAICSFNCFCFSSSSTNLIFNPFFGSPVASFWTLILWFMAPCFFYNFTVFLISY